MIRSKGISVFPRRLLFYNRQRRQFATAAAVSMRFKSHKWRRGLENKAAWSGSAETGRVFPQRLDGRNGVRSEMLLRDYDRVGRGEDFLGDDDDEFRSVDHQTWNRAAPKSESFILITLVQTKVEIEKIFAESSLTLSLLLLCYVSLVSLS